MDGSPIGNLTSHDPPRFPARTRRMASNEVIVFLFGLILIAGHVFWFFRHRSRDVLTLPEYVDLGIVDENAELMAEIAIHNNSEQNIRCIGIPSRCDLGCVEAPQIPFVIGPGETHVTRMKFSAPSIERLRYRGISTNVVSESVDLYFDHPQHSKEKVQLRYSVRRE